MIGTLLSIGSIIGFLSISFASNPRFRWAETLGAASPLAIAGVIVAVSIALLLLALLGIAPLRTWGFWMMGVMAGSALAFVILLFRGYAAFGTQLLLLGVAAFIGQYLAGIPVRAMEGG